ncbi:OmpH family outer membrane protein [uncultured Alistipes sp.]|uniref:OmpH family outer membrane protein n=1 Tax=uncultured Alistipes sp. TaxID=538949 RepID=UPI002621698B|nr:OmpH family outer membrane protein [uncultured Alistipes sp.]
MKNAIRLTLAVVLVMSATSLFAQKFGRINTSEIIASMPEMKEMQVNMENFGKTLNEGIEAINVEYTTKLQEYQKNFNTLPEATREMKAKDLQDLMARREQYQQAAQQDYEKKYNELMAPIIEKAKNAIDKVSQAGGFLAVFDMSTGAIVAFDETNLIDITPEVKKELGITETPAAAPAN